MTRKNIGKPKPFLMSAVTIFFFCAFATPSFATETYCQSSYINVYDGAEREADWTVVIGSARKAQKLGKDNPTTGCSSSWRSLGPFYRPIEILKSPKIGETKINPRYRIFFKPTKIGQDELIVRIHWIQGTTTKKASAIVKYKIRVVDRPI